MLRKTRNVLDYRVWVVDSRQSWCETASGKISPDVNIEIELAAPGIALVELEQ